MTRADRPNDAWQDLRPLLDQELQRLPARYRTAVVLCDLEEKTRQEAARQLGWPEGTLSSRLSRGRALLARRLARHGLTLSASAVALTFAQATATASVPAALVLSTVKAATCVVAGTATAGAVSAPVAALTKGVCNAMFLNKLKTTLVLILVLGLAGTGAGILTHQVLAQKFVPPESREKPSFKGIREETSELTGVVLAVDAGKNTLTLASKQPAQQTFPVARDARVFLEDGTGGKLGFQEGKLGDLSEGVLVTLRLSADRKTIVGIWAEGGTVRRAS